MIFSGKRGQWVQLSILVVFILLLGITALFMNSVSDELTTAINNEADISPEAKAVATVNNDAYPSIFDGILMFVFIGLWLGALVAAYNSVSNPLALILAILIVVILAVTGMFLSNMWDDLENDNQLSSYASQFPMSSFLLQNYLMVVLVVGFSTVGVMVMRMGGGFG